MDVSDLRTIRDNAEAALASGDYDLAVRYALSAQLLIGTQPNSTGPSTELVWDHRGIQGFLSEVRRERLRATAATGGVQRTKITRVRVSA